MKIIYLHQYFVTPDMPGGTRSYEMARRMVMAGHTVEMVTSRTDGKLPGHDWVRETIEGINVHWLPVGYDNTMSYARRIVAFFDFARKAGRYATKLGGDVVFATSTPLTIAYPGVRVSRALGVPMVFEVRDLWPELPIAMGALNFPFAKTAARALEKWAYRNSERVVALSPGMADGVVAAGFDRDRVACIPNSSDIELFNVPEERGYTFRSTRPAIGDRKLVVYAGTFGKINGVAYLAEIAAAMRSIDPEIRFLAVGRGAEYELVEQRAKALDVLDKNFYLEKAIAKAEIPALLSAATLCTSLFVPIEAMWHNSANKFFDALAAGRPIVINYGGWQADLIRQTHAGLTIDHSDAVAAARAIKAFVDDPATVANARQASAQLARSTFARDVLARQLINLLTEVVAESR